MFQGTNRLLLAGGLTLALLGAGTGLLAKDEDRGRGGGGRGEGPRAQSPQPRSAAPQPRQPAPPQRQAAPQPRPAAPQPRQPSPQPRQAPQPRASNPQPRSAPPQVRQPETPRVRTPDVPRVQTPQPRPETRRPETPRIGVPDAGPRRVETLKPELPRGNDRGSRDVINGGNRPDLTRGQNPATRGPETVRPEGPRGDTPPGRQPQNPGVRPGTENRADSPQPGRPGAPGSQAERDIQDRLRDRVRETPRPNNELPNRGPRPDAGNRTGDNDGPGRGPRTDTGPRPELGNRPDNNDGPGRGPGNGERDVQDRLRDQLKDGPRGEGRPGDRDGTPGDRRPDADRPDRGQPDRDQPDGDRPGRDLPGLPGRGGGPDNDRDGRGPQGDRPDGNDRDRRDGPDLGERGNRPGRDADIDRKLPNRMPIRIEKNGDVGKIAERPELQDQFRKLDRSRNPEDFRKNWNELRNRDDFRQDPALRNVNLNRVSGGFQSRIADRDWGNLGRARFATRINLDRQFGLYGRGDVGRQMNLWGGLNQRGGWGNRYYGPIAPLYRQNAFPIWYAGPSWYPRSVWHPRWSNWVAWSWWNRPAVFFDPRPFYCRPAIWNPCPVWTYYDYPTWQPLPVYAAAGTWVDVPPVEIPAQQSDLQLLAVRFVDPGHPDESIGPRFRMWLRNNSPADITTPFNVLMLASADTHADAALPQAGATIDRIDAGETIPVDVRLPFEANRIAKDDKGRSVPFNYLHLLVDSHRELEEANEENNGAVVARSEILPVDPAAFSTDVTAAAPGETITLAGEGLGPEPGQVVVMFNGKEQEAEVSGWYDLGIQFKLPSAQVANGAVEADIVVVRGDGAASNPVTVQIAPDSALSEAPAPSEPPLPLPPIPAQ